MLHALENKTEILFPHVQELLATKNFLAKLFLPNFQFFSFAKGLETFFEKVKALFCALWRDESRTVGFIVLARKMTDLRPKK